MFSYDQNIDIADKAADFSKISKTLRSLSNWWTLANRCLAAAATVVQHMHVTWWSMRRESTCWSAVILLKDFITFASWAQLNFAQRNTAIDRSLFKISVASLYIDRSLKNHVTCQRLSQTAGSHFAGEVRGGFSAVCRPCCQGDTSFYRFWYLHSYESDTRPQVWTIWKPFFTNSSFLHGDFSQEK